MYTWNSMESQFGNARSTLLALLALVCCSVPFVVGEPQVDNSGLVPLVISEELIPPPPGGYHYMMDGSLEGPNGIPADHTIITLNNTIPEANLIEGRIFDLPTGGLPSPMFGALDFDQEYSLLKEIRKDYDPDQIMLRVDANGAFAPSDAMDKLKSLADLGIHSIEQPIEAKQVDAMHQLCINTPIPIALDEELIGVFDSKDRKALLDAIMPQYIILKPSLLGGFKSCEEWISLAEERRIGWWVTSALESNIGLNAIAQWTYSLGVNNHQGLGTGGLFTNNFECPLEVSDGYLTFNSNQNWDIPSI